MRHNRRTCAKLCRAAGGELEQIQLLLGHASVQTTERYLGTRQDLVRRLHDHYDIVGAKSELEALHFAFEVFHSGLNGSLAAGSLIFRQPFESFRCVASTGLPRRQSRAKKSANRGLAGIVNTLRRPYEFLERTAVFVAGPPWPARLHGRGSADGSGGCWRQHGDLLDRERGIATAPRLS